MAPSFQLKRYRVFLYTRDAYKTFINAASEEEALEKAEDIYNTHGPEAFELWDDGIDEIVAEETEETA